MELPGQIAASLAQDRLNVALSSIKANADQQQAIANILDESLRSVPGSPVRGVNVNIKA